MYKKANYLMSLPRSPFPALAVTDVERRGHAAFSTGAQLEVLEFLLQIWGHTMHLTLKLILLP